MAHRVRVSPGQGSTCSIFMVFNQAKRPPFPSTFSKMRSPYDGAKRGFHSSQQSWTPFYRPCHPRVLWRRTLWNPWPVFSKVDSLRPLRIRAWVHQNTQPFLNLQSLRRFLPCTNDPALQRSGLRYTDSQQRSLTIFKNGKCAPPYAPGEAMYSA